MVSSHWSGCWPWSSHLNELTEQNSTDIATRVLSARCCDDADGLLLLPSCQAIGMAVHTAGASACREELLCCVGGKKGKLSAHFSFNWIIVW